MKLAQLTLVGSASLAFTITAGLPSAGLATPIFDSHGFESSAGYVSGTSLDMQSGLPDADQWADIDPSQAAQTVLTYSSPTAGNAQYVQLQKSGAANGLTDYTYPSNLPVTNFGANGQVTINWTMTNTTSLAATGNVFLGVTAFNGDGNAILAEAGINSATGLAYGVTDPDTGEAPAFVAAPNSAYAYELVLNYGATKSYALYAKPLGVDGAFSLVGTNAFEDSAPTDFGTAALTSRSLADDSSATAAVDDFSISVPEPGSLAAMGISSLILLRRRRGC